MSCRTFRHLDINISQKRAALFRVEKTPTLQLRRGDDTFLSDVSTYLSNNTESHLRRQ